MHQLLAIKARGREMSLSQAIPTWQSRQATRVQYDKVCRDRVHAIRATDQGRKAAWSVPPQPFQGRPRDPVLLPDPSILAATLTPPLVAIATLHARTHARSLAPTHARTPWRPVNLPPLWWHCCFPATPPIIPLATQRSSSILITRNVATALRCACCRLPNSIEMYAAWVSPGDASGAVRYCFSACTFRSASFLPL